MTERWVIGIAAVVAGLLVGAVLGWWVRRRLMKAQGGESTSAIAGAAGAFAFWIVFVVGVLIATAMFRPETLEDLPRRLLDYTPRLIVAGLILLVGYAVAVGASRLVVFGIDRAGSRTVARLARLVRWAVLLAAAILALAQLGVDTTVLLLLIGLAGLSIALSAALLVGLGGQSMARDIAAGRYLSKMIAKDARIEAGDIVGTVVQLRPATVELATPEGRRRHVPYSMLLEQGFFLDAGESPPPSE